MGPCPRHMGSLIEHNRDSARSSYPLAGDINIDMTNKEIICKIIYEKTEKDMDDN